MRAIRICAILTLVLLAVYYGLRALATACSGPQCDIYIPLSLLIPLAALVLAAVTGGLAIAAARAGAQRMWVAVLSVFTLLGVIGPIVGLAVLRDHPDQFVLTATLLLLLAPLGALLYSLVGNTSSR